MIDMKECGLKARRIKYFFTDVDGTLTDGNSYYSARGEEMKKFSLRDGGGFHILRNLSITAAIITGETTPIVERRAEKLKLEYCFMGVRDKLQLVSDFVAQRGASLCEVAFIGDDINDYELLKAVGLSFAPAGAHPRVREIVDYLCTNDGGSAAFREAVEIFVSLRGDDIIEVYNSK